jgi:hypothetical protein
LGAGFHTGKIPTKRHFFTLPATLEDAPDTVKRFPLQNTTFINELKDLQLVCAFFLGDLESKYLYKLGTYSAH